MNLSNLASGHVCKWTFLRSEQRLQWRWLKSNQNWGSVASEVVRRMLIDDLGGLVFCGKTCKSAKPCDAQFAPVAALWPPENMARFSSSPWRMHRLLSWKIIFHVRAHSRVQRSTTSFTKQTFAKFYWKRGMTSRLTGTSLFERLHSLPDYIDIQISTARVKPLYFI